MIDIDNMSDVELAMCVDAYIQRAINSAREHGYTKQISISVFAVSFQTVSEYEITHSVTVGSYGEECKVKSNNAIIGAKQLIPAIQNVEVDKPMRVMEMLAAPIELQTIRHSNG